MSGNLTAELKRILKYVQDNLSVTYPSENMGAEYFIYALLNDEKSIGYQILDKTMFEESKNTLKNTLEVYLSENATEDNTEFDMTYYDDVIERIKDDIDNRKVNSGHLLLSFITNNRNVKSLLKKFGVNHKIIKDSVSLLLKVNKEMEKKEKNTRRKKNKYTPKGIADEYVPIVKEMNGLAPLSKIVGNKGIVKSVFVALSKMENNNVLLIGEKGSGRGTIVRQIANLIFEENVPDSFKDKTVLNFRGGLGNILNHFSEIYSDAEKRGKYIFFVDDIDSLIYDGSPYVDILQKMLSNKNIQVLATAMEGKYNRSEGDKLFGKWLRKINVPEKTEDETIEILNTNRQLYEEFYGVSYPKAIIKECVSMAKRYVPNAVLPQAAVDVFDESGALVHISQKKNGELSDMQKRLAEIQDSKTKCAEEHDDESYSEYAKKELDIKREIDTLEKEEKLSKKRPTVTSKDIMETIASISGLPLAEITTTERDRLLTMEDKLKEKIVGQDNAVSEVVKTVKRQRVGLGKPGKPSVMMFVGNSGTGKTHLAKTLAVELFGDENSFVRVDMSEYNDKTSVNKIYGSSAGYVGYDNGGIITEAVKKHKHCVLLLDEMEKAVDEVHDVFLQMFDEGRLTDNKGVTVDFSNCIVIMTSNIGTKEASLRGDGVGFMKNGLFSEEIIRKEIKKRFKPEFINRIDNIIMFNKLCDTDIKKIIEIEIRDLEKRVNSIGFTFSDDFVPNAIEHIFTRYLEENEGSEFGARPIVRMVRNEIEDRITEYIIKNNPDTGHVFAFSEIVQK